MSYNNVPGDYRCECWDNLCPTAHNGKGQCTNKATQILWRIDMENYSGTLFCDECAEDAWESGLFTDIADEDESE